MRGRGAIVIGRRKNSFGRIRMRFELTDGRRLFRISRRSESQHRRKCGSAQRRTMALPGFCWSRGLAAEQIARVVGFFEPCGAGSFQEMYRLRPLWGVFLAVTNIANEPVRLAAIVGHVDQSMLLAVRPLEEVANSREMEVALPAASIPSGSTVLIPVGTVLAPLENVRGEEGARSEQGLSSTQWQTFAHMRYSPGTLGECRLIGASMRPHGLWIEAGGERRRSHRITFG